MFFSESKFIVRYAETDQMGIVHHSNYAIWFEAGRTELIKKMGMSYSEIERHGVLLPLIELRCKFKSPALYEDEISVKTSVKDFKLARITFYYEVYRANTGELLSIGETEHAWTDKELKPLNIKKQANNIYEMIEKAVREEESV